MAKRATKTKVTKVKAKKARAPKKAARKSRPAKKAKPARKVVKPAKKVRAKAKPAARAKPAAPARNPVRELAQRIIDVTMANDDEAILALYADDVVSTEMDQPPTQGLDAVRSKFAGWRSMVSEAHFEPRRVCVDGNTIVIEWLGRVTLAASGKQTEMREVAIHEIRDGKIAREAYYYNPASLS